MLADRAFLETAVRLHRAGEGAAYTGLKPAGLDYGPVIPAAEHAVATGDLVRHAPRRSGRSSLLSELADAVVGLEAARAGPPQ